MISTVKSHDLDTHEVMFWHDFSHGDSWRDVLDQLCVKLVSAVCPFRGLAHLRL
jgi:hypothetical protein